MVIGTKNLAKNQELVTVEITENTRVKGESAPVGKRFTAPLHELNILLKLNKAKLVGDEPAPVEDDDELEVDPDEVEEGEQESF